jgi:hypothetical protein
VAQIYLDNILSIEDVTALAHSVGNAHSVKKGQSEAVAELAPHLPLERCYIPLCPETVLRDLGMLPGDVARAVAGFGLGKAAMMP